MNTVAYRCQKHAAKVFLAKMSSDSWRIGNSAEYNFGLSH
jgi:hypothetical protein